MMLRKKNAVIFSIIALIIVFFLITSFFYFLDVPFDAQTEVTRLKIMNTNNFLSQVESFVEAQTVISSKLAITALIDEMNKSNAYFDDFDREFKRCLLEGTMIVSGEDVPCGEGAHFNERIEDLSRLASDNLRRNTEFHIKEIYLEQNNPWYLKTRIIFNVVVDEENYAYWNVSMNLSSAFSIVGFIDPVHAVVHPNLESYKFSDLPRITHDSKARKLGVDDWKEQPSTLNFIVLKAQYFEHNMSPSFLDRLRGVAQYTDFNDAGIVSIISPHIFDASSIKRSGASSMDWQFWQNISDEGGLMRYGEFDFDRVIDSSLKYRILNDSVHPNLDRTIVPVQIAKGTNMSNISGEYFFVLD